jgi:NADH:ubiquinone oxidoreductase subunit 4 (subunit M)
MAPLVVLMVLIGVYPSVVLNMINQASQTILSTALFS